METNQTIVDQEAILKGRKMVVGKSQEESSKGYDIWAARYEEDLFKAGYTGHILIGKYMCDVFPEKENRSKVNIIDIGAGTGLAALELRKLGFTQIDALEPNESMLNEARRRNLYQNYFVDFITENPLNIPEDTYDALTGSGIFAEGCHVKAEALFEMIRLVKPGGYVILSTRHHLVTDCEVYKSTLEPLMDKLEADKKWRKVSRDIWPRFYNDLEAIAWVYQVL